MLKGRDYKLLEGTGMTFGIFEAASSSQDEIKLAADEQARKLQAAIYDVREKFGPFLFASTGLDDFGNREALIKHDAMKVINAHVPPVTGVTRRVFKALRNEYKKMAENTGEPYRPAVGDYQAYPNAIDAQSDAGHNFIEGEGPSTIGNPESNFTASLRVAEGAPAAPMTADPAPAPMDMGAPAEADMPIVASRLAYDMYHDWCHGNGLKVASRRNLEAYAPNVSEPEFRAIEAELIKLDDGCDCETKNHDSDERDTYDAKRESVDDGKGDGGSDRKSVDTKGKDGYKDRKAKPSKATEKREKEENPVPLWGDRKRQSALILTAGYHHAYDNSKDIDQEDPNAYSNRHDSDDNWDPVHGESQWDKKKSALELTAGYHTAAGAVNTGQQLQKASDDITDLLNGLAEQFQESVMPLQQALQAIQYAQTVQQQSNPMGVMPGGGISVLPPAGQQDQGPALGQVGFADPSAMAQAGGDPTGAAGGAVPPPPADAAAAGAGAPPAGPPAGPPTGAPPLDPMQQQMMASRSRRPFESASRREAWQGWGHLQPGARRVAGWEWNDRLNGYETTARKDFPCSCGQRLATPGFHNCKCGKIWNTYAIGSVDDLRTSSAQKYLAREIPARENVIVASKTAKPGHPPEKLTITPKQKKKVEKGEQPTEDDVETNTGGGTDAEGKKHREMAGSTVYDYPHHPAGPVQSDVPLGISELPDVGSFEEPSKWEQLKERVRSRPGHGGFAGGRSAANAQDNWVYNPNMGGYNSEQYKENEGVAHRDFQPTTGPYKEKKKDKVRPEVSYFPKDYGTPAAPRPPKDAKVERRDVTQFDREGDGYEPADVKNMRDNPSDWWNRRSDGKWVQGPAGKFSD